MFPRLPILLFVMLLVCCVRYDVAAQQPAEGAEGKASVCDTDLAKFLVQQHAAESDAIADTGKRIRILIRAAEFLWRLDESSSREYLSRAFTVASDRFREGRSESRNDKGSTATSPDYRFQVIRSIAAHDPEWAKRLVDQVLKEAAEDEKRSESDKLNEISSTIRIAVFSVRSDPQLSWYLFRRVMSSPLDIHWYAALYGVAGADPRFADALYSELIRNYTTGPRAASPRQFLFLSAYPFANERILGIDKFSYGASVPAGMRPDPTLKRQFIAAFLDLVNRFAADPTRSMIQSEGSERRPESLYAVAALEELESIVLAEFPAMAQRFSEVKARAAGLLSDDLRRELTERTKTSAALATGFEDRLAEIEKAEADGRLTDLMIVRLVTWGDSAKTEEQFKKILPWIDKIKDGSVRKETEKYFWFLRSKTAIGDRRFADAERFAAKVPELDHRAVLMLDLAKAQLKDANTIADAQQLLAGVEQLAARAESSVAKARVLLGLASAYEDVNHVFALDALRDAVKTINQLDDPDIMTSALRRQIVGKGFSHYAVYELPNADLETTFRLISKNDFSLALSNARALDDRFFRAIAVFAVAQNCIDKPQIKDPRRPAKRPAKRAGA
ncbi:MAG: hypothetical protein ACK4S4_13365 [Pyrinomonadaceae bacterium]